jgi:O-antigen/teichoic acid export membrane protein
VSVHASFRAAWHAESTLWYFVPTVIGAVLPLLTLPVITAVLTPAEYGAWVLAVAFGSFLAGLGNFGLTVAYDRNYFEFTDPRLNAALLWGTTALVGVLLSILLGASWVGRHALAERVLQIPGQGTLIAWTATAVGVGTIKQYFLLFFRNRHEARRYALFSIDESVLSAVFTIVLVHSCRVGPVGLAWGPLFASTVVLLALLRSVSRHVPFVFSREPLIASLRMSYPLMPRLIFGVLGAQFDKWVVGVLGGAGSVGVYAIGQKLAHVVFLVSTALENKFQPRTYQLLFEGGEDAGTRIGALLTPFAYVTAGCGLVLSLFAKEAVAILTTAEYASAAAICYILMLHYALMFFGKQPQLLYAKKTGLLSVFSISSMLVSALFMAFGAMTWGPIGAAGGLLLGGILGTWVFIRISQQFFRIEFETVRLAQFYGLLAASCGLMLAGYWWEWGGLAMIPVKVSLLAGYGWIGWRGGVLPKLLGVGGTSLT